MKLKLLATILLMSASASADEVFVGAGDIAVCSTQGDEKTATLLDDIPGTVFTLGDNAYGDGTAQEFSSCFEPNWGRHKVRMRPSPGNHDYRSTGAQPYRDYFGVPLNYAYDLGDWHIVSLDSNCELPGNGGCGLDSPTMQWLKSNLELNSKPCTLVYFHHPRWSSNLPEGGSKKMQTAWTIMFNAGVDVVLAGHSHSYERFAPFDAQGRVNWSRGLRSFVVGTGGAELKLFSGALAGSQVRNGATFGVLKLVLRAADYTWQFIPVAGKTFTDSGSGVCH
jgi:acid phosphatase type 7